MRWAPALALIFCAACEVTASVGDTPDELWTELRLGAANNNQIDLLFMIDDSPSMGPKQAELRARFPQLVDALEQNAIAGHPAHYHIGVVTSDLGAGPFNLDSGQCHPGGDAGKLQGIGAGANQGCLAPVGANYIDLDQLSGDNNLPLGSSVSDVFSCMASVGDQGCGFESQLESVYRALQNPPPENAGFLRSSALLAVVFLTDEDDCSAPPDTDLFDPGPAGARYGALLSFRCTQYGIVCGTPPAPPPYGDSGGPIDGCVPAPNDPSAGGGPGKLYDVNRYLNFFRRPASEGGVKEFPGDAFLFAIDAPASPFSVITADLEGPPGPYRSCSGPVNGTSCAAVVQHSCIRATDTTISGDPAVRLNAVVGATLPSVGTSICDDSYVSAMSALASTIISYQSGNGCLPGPVPDTGDPSCRVYDESANPDGSFNRAFVAECDRVAQAPPCWSVITSGECAPFINPTTGEQQNLQLVIDRGGQPPPQGATTRASCVILTH